MQSFPSFRRLEGLYGVPKWGVGTGWKGLFTRRYVSKLVQFVLGLEVYGNHFSWLTNNIMISWRTDGCFVVGVFVSIFIFRNHNIFDRCWSQDFYYVDFSAPLTVPGP
jgi:hypothetical protein